MSLAFRTVLALAVLSGCSARPAELVSAITMERSTCFGTCPSYRLTIDTTGLVLFEGQSFVRLVGRDSSRIDRGAAQAVFTRFELAWADTRPRRVTWGDSSCGSPATDHPSLIVTRRRAKAVDTLELYYGCSHNVERIDRVGAFIDSVAGTDRWLRP